MNDLTILVIAIVCWVHGVMMCGVFYELKYKNAALKKLKQADRLLQNAEENYKRSINILRVLSGASLIFRCESIVNNLEEKHGKSD